MTLRTKFLTRLTTLSLIAAVVTGALQLKYEYDQQLHRLNTEIASVEDSTLPALVSAVWALDQKQTLNLAQSVFALPNIDHVMVKGNGIETVTLGTLEPGLDAVSRVFTLKHAINNRQIVIGTLTVHTSLAPLRKALRQRAWVISAAYLGLIAMIALGCQLLLKNYVGRPLTRLQTYFAQARSLNDLEPFSIARSLQIQELDALQNTVNQFRDSLKLQQEEKYLEYRKLSAFTQDNPEIIWRADLTPPLSILQEPHTLLDAVLETGHLSELNSSAKKVLDTTDQHANQPLLTLPFINQSLLVEMINNNFQLKEYVTQFQDHDGDVHYFRNSLACWIEQDHLHSIWGIAIDITQSLTTQKALEQRERQLYLSQTRLSEAQALAHMGHWSYAAQGDHLQVSDEFARIYGFENDMASITWRGLLERIHPEDKSYVVHTLSDPRTQAAGAEHRILWPNGETRFVQAITRKSISGGVVESTFGILIDITDRRRAEEERSKSQRALAESEARLAQAQAIAHMGHWLLDSKTQELLCSDEFYRLLGHIPQFKPFTQASFLDHVHRDDRPLVKHLLESAKEKSFTNEFRIIKQSGEQRFMRGTFTPFYAGGKSTTRIFGILMDVTEQKTAESELRSSQELFATAFDASPDGLFLVDCETNRFLKVNAAFTQMLDTTEHTLLKKRFNETPLFIDDQQNKHICLHLELQQSATNIEIHIELPGSNSVNGLMSWQHVRIAQKPCVLGIIHDVTAIRRLQKTTNEQQKQLIQADKLASIGTMVAGVAHEINNPNHLIQMNTDLLEGFYNPLLEAAEENTSAEEINGLSFSELKATVPELLSDLKISSHRINRIVNDLKDFARPQENAEFKEININDTIDKTLKLLSSLIEKHAMTITLDLDPTLPSLYADDQRIEQVLVNLIMNAIEASEHSDKRLSICTATKASKEEIICEVKDNGCGIDADHIKRIFDPFYTTKQDKGGTGLGLAISYRLIQEHGGTLQAKTHAGSGTTMRFTLPTLKFT